MQNIAFINNEPFEIKPGESILTFVRRYKGQNFVPTLCDAPNLEAFGSCRVCSVEVSNARNESGRIVASCHNEVRAGSYIYTDSSKVEKLRKNIVELVLTDHPLDCLICEANNNCELQDVAARVGITGVRYPEGKNHKHYKKDTSHPYMVSDLSKCINCYRCVRACDEVQGELVLAIAGRGFDSRIIKGSDTSFGDSYCVSCGACSQACPTNAISDIYKPQTRMATEKVRTVCTYCGVGCNLDVYKKDNTILGIKAPFDAEVNLGHTCLKGRYAFGFYKHPERLSSPMIKRNGKQEKVSWDEAYDFIVEKLTAIRSENGPDAIAGISSSRCTNEENYLMQKFIRAVIGTNNIDGCARVCHAPTAAGMRKTFGTGAATNSIEDLNHTDCVLVIGANPNAAHPVTGAKIRQHALRGKMTIVLDPRKTEIAKLAHYHLQLRPGTNVAVLNMMIYYIIADGLIDETFISTRCEGYDHLKENILKLDIDQLEAVSGVDRNLVRKAAAAYAKADAAMSFHGLGVTEHYQGTNAVMLIADLAMLTGNVGKKGCGVNPLRGQNNVQGMADMGVQPHLGPGYLDVTNETVREGYDKVWGVKSPGGKGLTTQAMMNAALSGSLKALWIMGEDLVQTEPNTHKVRKALSSLDLLVVQELFESETTQLADVVLPAASFFEKSGTFTNGERRIQRVNAVIDPIPGTKPDGQIIAEIMQHMGYPQPDYNPDTLLQEISQVVPFFEGVVWNELGDNGKQWPVKKGGIDTKILHQDTFKLGKGRLQFVDFIDTPELEMNADDYPYILTTNRNLQHYNSGSMTRRTKNVLISKEDFLIIHPDDAAQKRIKDGDKVRIISARGEASIRAMVSDMVKPGILSCTFHFPELQVNNVASEISDVEVSCPEFKVIAVQIEKVLSENGNGKSANGKHHTEDKKIGQVV